MTNYLTEYDRWMKSAKTTLRSATNDKLSEFYNWTCFKAQQASEYAVMAYLRGTGKCYYGHSISLLLVDLQFSKEIVDLAKNIDKYYIPTRYTDAWSEGNPEDYYTLEDASEAIECTERIINEIEAKWKSLKER
jgi:HEPN domain-containing protein